MSSNGSAPVGVSKNIKQLGRMDLPGGGSRLITPALGVQPITMPVRDAVDIVHAIDAFAAALSEVLR